MRCRECGCIDENGCLIEDEYAEGMSAVEACWWVEPDLCSGCAYDITIRGPVGVQARQQQEAGNA